MPRPPPTTARHTGRWPEFEHSPGPCVIPPAPRQQAAKGLRTYPEGRSHDGLQGAATGNSQQAARLSSLPDAIERRCVPGSRHDPHALGKARCKHAAPSQAFGRPVDPVGRQAAPATGDPLRIDPQVLEVRRNRRPHDASHELAITPRPKAAGAAAAAARIAESLEERAPHEGAWRCRSGRVAASSAVPPPAASWHLPLSGRARRARPCSPSWDEEHVGAPRRRSQGRRRWARRRLLRSACPPAAGRRAPG